MKEGEREIEQEIDGMKHEKKRANEGWRERER
jgi:hypothetical protein